MHPYALRVVMHAVVPLGCSAACCHLRHVHVHVLPAWGRPVAMLQQGPR
jgi:hypothetical protein